MKYYMIFKCPNHLLLVLELREIINKGCGFCCCLNILHFRFPQSFSRFSFKQDILAVFAPKRSMNVSRLPVSTARAQMTSTSTSARVNSAGKVPIASSTPTTARQRSAKMAVRGLFLTFISFLFHTRH